MHFSELNLRATVYRNYALVDNQLARRNLTPEQTKYLMGVRYELEKQSHGGQIPGSSDQNDHSLKTAEKLAKEYGVSAPTIRRAAKFAEAVDKLPEDDSSNTYQNDLLSRIEGKT